LELTINGEKRQVDGAKTLAELATRLGLDTSSRGIAIAVNDTVIPRPRWSTVHLSSGDRVEVIHAVQGG
jgi:sulfur carrier protein